MATADRWQAFHLMSLSRRRSEQELWLRCQRNPLAMIAARSMTASDGATMASRCSMADMADGFSSVDTTFDGPWSPDGLVISFRARCVGTIDRILGATCSDNAIIPVYFQSLSGYIPRSLLRASGLLPCYPNTPQLAAGIFYCPNF
jgi:hypothetical protein